MTRRILLPALLVLAACSPEELDKVFPDLFIQNEQIDFGKIPVLHIARKNLVAANRGLARMNFQQVEIVGDDAPHFSVGEFPDQVSAGGEHTFAVTFRPRAEGSFQATLRIETNDPDEGTAQIALIGVGDTIAAIEVVPGVINFGIVGEGVSAVETFTIRSVGTADLIVEEVKFTSETPAEFLQIGSWGGACTPEDMGPCTLPVLEEVLLSVGFSPRRGQVILTGQIEIRSTDPANRVLVIDLAADVNRAPSPLCGTDEIIGAPGDIVSFDGTGSSDADGHEPVSYSWVVKRRPLDSNTALDDDTSPTPSLELDVAGDWEIELCVTDALGVQSLDCCRVNVKSIPSEKLYIELIWDHPSTNLDLHFLEPDAALGGPGDCFWGNPTPDFGQLNFDGDDPYLDRDDLAGFGPEIVTYPDPLPGIYRIIVDYANDNGAANPATEATVRIYQFGVLVAELSRTINSDCTLWSVASVEWPSGDVAEINSVATNCP